ncbi:MAG: citronellol/citronellal dehydrogenase [Bradymonadia bacterium]|jgi:citronellol/citronellal dehydrogenase
MATTTRTSRELHGKVALITGASRGIGKAVALRLARAGCRVVVAAKTTEPHPKLPGTIHTTVAACKALGPDALAVKMDVRDPAQVDAGVAAAIEAFGRLDIVIHNAGALWWKPLADTPVAKFDLVMDVNVRGAYALAYAAVPHLKAAGGGHFLTMSPPIDDRLMKGKIAYLISKFGMTMVAKGVAAEHARDNIAGNALWPETAIESAATRNFGFGGPEHWYTADIVADATFEIVRRPPAEQTGQALLVMDVLRAAGVTDFVPYRCVADSEPPMLNALRMPRAGGAEGAGGKVHED